MEKETLYGFIENCDRLDAATSEELKSVVEEYPYFHTARLLYTKNLNLTESQSYEEELSKTAILCNDRRKLFYLIYRKEYGELLNNDEDIHPNRGDRTEELLESFLSSLGEREMIEPVVENAELNIVATDYLTYLESIEEKTPERETAHDGQTENRQLQHHDIIDAFIEKAETEILFTPKETTSSHTGQSGENGENGGNSQNWSGETGEDWVNGQRQESRQSWGEEKWDEEKWSGERWENGEERSAEIAQSGEIDEEGGDFLTETLARIYIKQKKYEQALTIIKRLSLNFPKKSVYFAHQIRFLELLIINEKNKE